MPVTHAVYLRIVASDLPGRAGQEIALPSGRLVIGRADDCGVVLHDGAVSRRHAAIEPAPDGFHLVDMASANGVWIGDQRVAEVPLTHGMRFRVGTTTFEFVAPRPDDLQAAARATAPREFLVRVTPRGSGPSRDVRVKTKLATIGRAEDCTVPLDDNSVSRYHARVDFTAEGRFRVIDTGSVNGVWIDDRRVTDETIAENQPFRIGNTNLQCVTVAERADDHTVVMADFSELMGKMASREIEKLGEQIVVAGSQAILLDDPRYAYYVVNGPIEIFTVTVKEGRPLGARNHFLTVRSGEAFFGIDPRYTEGSGFLASGKSGTDVRRIPRDRLLPVCRDPHVATLVTTLVDGWVGGLSSRLTRDIMPHPSFDLSIVAGRQATLQKGKRVHGGDLVAWVTIRPDELLYIGLAALAPPAPTSFPLTSRTWIEPADETDRTIDLDSRQTGDLLKDGSCWPALDYFHQVLCECEFINKQLALVDEVERLASKARQSEGAREAALDAIGSVLAGRGAEPRETGAGSVAPLIEACTLVAEALALKVQRPAESRVERTFEDQLNAIASASRFRTRTVALRGDWWTGDHGPMLAVIEQTASPVALLPRGPRRYVAVEPATGERTPVNEAFAGRLSPFAHCFYRPLPVGKLSGMALVKFGGRSLGPEFRAVAAMGVLTGVLGTMSPYLTGRIVDSAIPSADRALLVQLGLAMLLAAVATGTFKLTQSFAVARIETKMDYVLQAAIWDRLLDLPSGFFRQYGSGDLAERAFGIDTIRGVVSRAGVTGILGSISSVFYIALMFSYSATLTIIAVLITLVIVTFTTLGNYGQLRFQRLDSTQRGQISSLVLQLIAGVAKVRVCAAENHAFRVWAQKFSTLKRTGTSIGQVQNVVGTGTAAFPVLSSFGVFFSLYYLQSSQPPGTPPPFTTGSFIAFNAAFGAFISALLGLSDASLSILKVLPVFERVRPILDTAPEADESKAAPGRLRGELSVSHLHFRYTADGPWVLKDISFSIKPGEFVAFVGSSGCGKSTMLRLLLGFERPQSGTIHYDGQDLAALDARAVRQQLGVVLQESRLLPTDIFRNIVGTTSHTMDEAWEAAEMGGLADDIRQMPMQMHTVVSEGGGTFSGGQRQRLLIARALVNKPRLIYFDEATSALDNKAQAVVTHSMDRLDATRIVIAHRLSTIVNADRIFYFDQGQIAEQGTYDELLRKGGLFAQLARRQIV